MAHEGMRAATGTADLSLGGAYLRTQLLLEEHEHVELEIQLRGQCIHPRGEIVRVLRGAAPGLAVRFTDMSDDDRRVLAEFLR